MYDCTTQWKAVIQAFSARKCRLVRILTTFCDDEQEEAHIENPSPRCSLSFPYVVKRTYLPTVVAADLQPQSYH